MTSWIARAKAHFSQKRPERTDETDITPISSVMSVGVEAIPKETREGFVGFVGTDRDVLPENDELPPGVVERIGTLLRAGRIDEEEADLVRTRYRAYPAREWEMLFDWLEASR